MKFCVIGLGRFGYQVATILADNGMEVLAIDSSDAIVASIRDHVTQAICMRVADESSLRSVGIEEMDTVIVAMGENFAQSILVTALLKKRLKIPQVITRAISDIHKEILQLIGADQVILPEKEVGIRLADTLSSPFSDFVRITQHFAIGQMNAIRRFIGKSIQELAFHQTYGVHCIGIRTGEAIASIAPDYTIQEGDKLIFAGSIKDLEKVLKG
jgi:trk system potassium uptake protein TrkA